ncbi:hypothetical protein HYDPIDRAFT_24039 [Hydnomerulius pinastri MD-312]|nr:hypothetical protein HYDPIDRAFT_24039 [Hydnomerulius pinastri MD-312]
MTAVNVAQAWGPGVVGLVISLAMYGATLGQFWFYVRSFPTDTKILKLAVLLVFILDSAHAYSLAGLYWELLISCRRSNSYECVSILPWEMLMGVVVAYWITFAVQSFYAHRVWIISAKNKFITGAVLGAGLAQIILGMLCSAVVIQTPSAQALFSTRLSPLPNGKEEILWLHSTSQNGVYKYGTILMYGRRRNVRLDGHVGEYYTALTGAFLGKSYINSMLAVLNARRSIREREREDNMIDLSGEIGINGSVW